MISIIIPSYNAAKGLQRCIDSIINAQIIDLPAEIILVNDGSTDATLEICNQNRDKYENIIVVSHENKGLSGARNSGLKIAKGDYIAFVDSDDFVELNYFKSIHKYLKNEPDVLGFGYKRLANKIEKDNNQDYIWNRKDILENLKISTSNRMLWFVWKRIYKKSFLIQNKIHFDEDIKYGEDSVFSLKVFKFINSYQNISDCIYNYVDNPQSLTQIKYKENLLIKFEKQYILRKEIEESFLNTKELVYKENLAKNYIEHVFLSLLNNLKNSTQNQSTELRNIRNSIIYRDLFKYYKYDWRHPKKSLMIKLFEFRFFRILKHL